MVAAVALLAVGGALAATGTPPGLIDSGFAGSDASPSGVQPFGKLSCEEREGVRYCEGSTATRVKTFDGVPLDVNVTLPASGDGNFPLVIQLHGWGGAKSGLGASKRWAQEGYAVLNYTARGFGNSCGSRGSRQADPEGCAKGWVRLADSRYEVRDSQHLAGLLADQGLVDPQRIGATGGSYGGGQSLQLAALKDRIRRPDGSYAPWRSPQKGLPMAIAAAAPTIPWSDLVYSLVPNGRTLDYTVTDEDDDLRPLGTMKETYVTGLYAAGQASGYYAPPRADPDADLTTWYGLVQASEPYDENPLARDVVDELSSNHSAYYLDDSVTPAPLLISNGFTDDLFPVDEAVRFANRTRERHPNAKVAQLHFDYGHARGQNKSDDTQRLTEAIHDWFNRHVKGEDTAVIEGVEARTQTCPKDEEKPPSGGPFTAPSWDKLSPGEVRFGDAEAKSVVSLAGDPQAGAATDPIAGRGACATAENKDFPGTAVYRLPKVEDGYTLLGSPTVIADLSTTSGKYSALFARLWDVAPDGKTQTLVARGIYRPSGNGRQVFQLHSNGWRFEPGHTPKLELSGQDAPYGRPSNVPAAIQIGDLDFRLPTHERRGGQVGSPAEPFYPPRSEPLKRP